MSSVVIMNNIVKTVQNTIKNNRVMKNSKSNKDKYLLKINLQ